jgi:uncharacterized membrane protein
MRLANEAGSTLLLTIAYAALSLAVILVVVSVTSLYLERERLMSLADGAALVGAEAFDVDAPPSGGEHPGPTLTSDGVKTAVSGYVTQSQLGHFESLQVVRAVTVDGRSATVELTAEWRPPVFALFVPDGIRLNVTSIARSVFR